MLRSTFKTLQQFYRPWSGVCGKSPACDWTIRGIVSSQLTQNPQNQFPTDDSHFLQIDCEEECFHSLTKGNNSSILSRVEENKPEVVFLEHLRETDFWGKIQAPMRHLGYTGSVEDFRHGRVKGVFVRNDLVPLLNQCKGKTVYKSEMPDPL
ncbi:uncharacterized protein LOC133186428 isoform X2 [Saccostrea echinata]|uniref:uncharacterized protein LOC133186428 isoform X2 n=1 Tax=Saccostrea echinata TaxID=191078 RepID=UPI002A823D9D|nr:uncharacterized protein LOC133186428 isoform X2 [Saccostrea echinata]